MAILKKEDFLAKLQEKFGSDNSDESITFIEDMVDTYNDLENRTKGDGVDWKRKYEENDAAWLKRYQHRFFSGGNMNFPKADEDESDDDKIAKITINDLFK
jgi:hypothetical protein